MLWINRTEPNEWALPVLIVLKTSRSDGAFPELTHIKG
jgi:hypothetical protein